MSGGGHRPRAMQGQVQRCRDKLQRPQWLGKGLGRGGSGTEEARWQNLGLLSNEEKGAQGRSKPSETHRHIECLPSGLGWHPFPHGLASTSCPEEPGWLSHWWGWQGWHVLPAGPGAHSPWLP